MSAYAKGFSGLALIVALLAVFALLPKDAVDPRRVKWSKCPDAGPATACITVTAAKSEWRREIEGRLKWLGLPSDVGKVVGPTCRLEVAKVDETNYDGLPHGFLPGPEQHAEVKVRICDYPV